MNQPRPKKQHYVTRSYLSNFCASGAKETLWVYDLIKAEWRKTIPKNEAYENHFQTLKDSGELDPYFLEKEFNKIENAAIIIIRKMLNSKIIPSMDEFHNVLNLAGLFAIRNPYQRDQLNKLYENELLKRGQAMVDTESNYYTLMNQAKEKGIIQTIEPYDDAKEFFEKAQFKVDQSYTIVALIKVAEACVDVLLTRKWMLVEAIESPYFICSNNPVNIIRINNTSYASTFYEDPDGIITFPLSPKFALIGTSFNLPAYREIDKSTVEGINWCTAFQGAQFIYYYEETELPKRPNLGNLYNFMLNLKTGM